MFCDGYNIVGHTSVESLLTDTPRKGHCIKYLSTMDKTKSPNFNPPINIMQLESLKEDNLYTGDKPLFILVQKCPFRYSTVLSCQYKSCANNFDEVDQAYCIVLLMLGM